MNFVDCCGAIHLQSIHSLDLKDEPRLEAPSRTSRITDSNEKILRYNFLQIDRIRVE